MIVYRIEHLGTGRGPYCDERPHVYDLAYSECTRTTQPDPYDDGIWGDNDSLWGQNQEYRYAFASLSQMLNWFSIDLIMSLMDNDYVIAEYFVCETVVRKGKKHLAFPDPLAECSALHDTLTFMSDHTIV